MAQFIKRVRCITLFFFFLHPVYQRFIEPE